MALVGSSDQDFKQLTIGRQKVGLFSSVLPCHLLDGLALASDTSRPQFKTGR